MPIKKSALIEKETNQVINNRRINNKSFIKDDVESIVTSYFINYSDNSDSYYQRFISILLAHGKVSGSQLKNPSQDFSSFMPINHEKDGDSIDEYALNLKLILSGKVDFDDFVNMHINQPLNNKAIKQKIYDGTTTLEAERIKFYKNDELQSLKNYKKLRLSIEDQIDRIHNDGGEDKADELSKELKFIDEKYSLHIDEKIKNKYYTEVENSYEFLARNTKNILLNIFDKKRHSVSTLGNSKSRSYGVISKTIEEINEEIKIKKVKENDIKPGHSEASQAPLNPSGHTLGGFLIQLLSSNDEDSIANAIENIKKFNVDMKLAFVNAYNRIFNVGGSNQKLFYDEKNCDRLLDNIHNDIFHKNNSDNIQDKESNQAKWIDVLSYTLAAKNTLFDNAFNTPVVDFIDDKEKMHASLTQAASFKQLVFQSEKKGGTHSAGELGGIYLRHYQCDGKLYTQESLIKQASKGASVTILDNMREAWGGFYTHSLAPDNNALISLVIKPNGVKGVAADVYIESQYFKSYVSAHQAAYAALGKKAPDRSKAKFAGQKIDTPLLGRPKFKEGLLKYVRGNGIDPASLADVLIPNLLAGNKQVHTENIGFDLVNGKRIFVGLDFGGAGRRPFSDSAADLKKDTELDEDFSDEIYFFKGRGNKLGACYARAYPVELFLDERFIAQSLRILEKAKANSEVMLTDNIAHIKENFGDDGLADLSASFKKKGNQEEFKDFIIGKDIKRINSLVNRIKDFQLWNAIKSGEEAKMREFFSKNSNYKLYDESVIDKHIFRSKDLRVLSEEDNCFNKATCIDTAARMYDEVRIGSILTSRVVRQACEQYQNDKDVRKKYNPFRNDSTLFKELNKWLLKHDDKIELKPKDKLELILLIDANIEAITDNSVSRKPAELLLQSLGFTNGNIDNKDILKSLKNISHDIIEKILASEMPVNRFLTQVESKNEAASLTKRQLSLSSPSYSENASLLASSYDGTHTYDTPTPPSMDVARQTSPSLSVDHNDRSPFSDSQARAYHTQSGASVNIYANVSSYSQYGSASATSPLSDSQTQTYNAQSRINANIYATPSSIDVGNQLKTISVFNQAFSQHSQYGVASATRQSSNLNEHEEEEKKNGAIPHVVPSYKQAALKINNASPSSQPLSSPSPAHVAQVGLVGTPNHALDVAMASMVSMQERIMTLVKQQEVMMANFRSQFPDVPMFAAAQAAAQ